MSPRFQRLNPAAAVEEAFFRIQRERMAELPILNPALTVNAIDFQRWQGHWLGIVVTSWCMSLLLLPGGGENWVSTGENKRRFVRFPAGDFAFVGGDEAELGEYQSCPLFSPMGQFCSQSAAMMTARAALIGLLTPVPQLARASAVPRQADEPSLARRRFLALR